MPRVSIVMGVYNIKSYGELKGTAESVIAQTFTDWEFIICDDGSTNDTRAFLERIGSMDPRIRIIGYPDNRGLASALNACIEASSGELIARQDADDISYPERLQREVDFLDEHPEYDIVGCNARLYDHENGCWGDYKTKEEPGTRDFLRTTQFLHPSVVIRRDSLLKAGKYRVAKETRRCQDYDLFMRMYSMGMRGYNLQEFLMDYYQKDGHQRELSWKRRREEAVLRWKGFRSLGLMPGALPFVVKPLVMKLLPQKLYRKLKKGEGGDSGNENGRSRDHLQQKGIAGEKS